MTTKAKPVLLKADIFWPELNSLNKYSNKYQVQLANLSPAAVEALSELNVDARNEGDERNYFITCKSLNPIFAKTSDGVDVPSDIKMANGSKAVAMVGSYQWKSGEGWSPTLTKLVITDLIEYEEDLDLDDEEIL